MNTLCAKPSYFAAAAVCRAMALALLGCPLVAQAIGLNAERIKTQWGDVTLQFSPAEFDLAPQRSHHKIGLRLTAEVLNLTLARTQRDAPDDTPDGAATNGLGGGLKTVGLRGRLQGQTSHYQQDGVNSQIEWFRRWEGRKQGISGWAPEIQLEYEWASGLLHDHLSGQDFWTVNASQSLRAPLPAQWQWVGQDGLRGQHPLYWLVDAKQTFSHRLNTGPGGRNWSEYSVLLGVQKDFPWQLMGKPAYLALMVGPEFSGDREKWAKVQGRVRLRLKF